MKILIVEDTEDIAMLLTNLLSQHGHDCYHVENGSRALESIEEDDFDLIVSDVNMPVMDGLTFAVQSRKKGLQAPIILFTGEPYLDPALVKDGGVRAIIHKCDTKGLLQVVSGFE